MPLKCSIARHSSPYLCKRNSHLLNCNRKIHQHTSNKHYHLKTCINAQMQLSIKKLFCTWKNHLALMTEIPSCIFSQYLCYNVNIQVDKTSIPFSRFSEKNINQVSQLFNDNSSIEKWHKFRKEYYLNQNYFQWVQLIDSYSRKNGNFWLKQRISCR